ncbi:D-alanyl-D-alanine carboxypeptidase/D-alanyl-D-alanine-endopeptidase [uncultured Kocuria sp.]|uniref:D-alanyl-D-alanine carboxypeptidase/D-alanyl-D-alanine endopeptidase n=1 Tax=uncultured Kocuria sp. TaxID=259305 RepID=UPI0025915A99|nr:D-alanyl-D-alanine carboxypeptidase/D-alanyl-D-alanine-endopeptidase [uncultured Kocuria sp.]
MSSRRPHTSKRKPSRGWWVGSAIVAAGCIGVGAWLVPTATANWDQLTGADQPHPLSSSSSAPASLADLPSDAPQPTAEQVSGPLSQIAQKLGGGGTLSAQVVDVQSGKMLYSDDAEHPVTPASNLKLLTEFALLSHSDPNARYSTDAYLAQDSSSLNLVAGGDTMLADGSSEDGEVLGHAGLGTLAERTVDRLAADGVKGNLPVNLDASMYTGQAVNPAWAPEDVDSGYATGISPIALWDHHTQRPSDGEDVSHRPENAGADALKSYVDALNRAGAQHGLSFSSGSTSAAATDRDHDQRLASVESATVLEQARYMMENSDNVLAEVLGRNAAVSAGNEGSIDGAIKTVKSSLENAGISTEGLTQKDSSGLSAGNRVTPVTLSHVIAKATQSRTATADLAETLPVGGGTGTLAGRFEGKDTSVAQGKARAKTGTLLTVNSLTGYTTTSKGRLLAYSLVVNDVKDSKAAVTALDESVARLTEL